MKSSTLLLLALGGVVLYFVAKSATNASVGNQLASTGI